MPTRNTHPYICRLVDIDVSFGEIIRGIKGEGYPWNIDEVTEHATLASAKSYARKILSSELHHGNGLKFLISRERRGVEELECAMYLAIRMKRGGWNLVGRKRRG